MSLVPVEMLEEDAADLQFPKGKVMLKLCIFVFMIIILLHIIL